MTTGPRLREIVAGAVPDAVHIAEFMVAVLSVEICHEALKFYPFRFLGVPLGFFDLADKTGLHSANLLT